ncbi:MAG TPA: SRPBCC family protein [Blastocatellia bacterium]
MTHFDVVVGIKAPPDQVLAVLLDVERWPDWTPSVSSIQRLDDGPLTIGSRAKIRQPKLMPAIWQVTELESGKRFAWVTRSPGVQIKGDHVVDRDGDGSRVTLSLQYSGLLAPILARFYRGLSERYLSLEANGLQKRCEGHG